MLVNALKLDLIGPEPGLGTLDEALLQAPSRWYLTGFLVPRDAGEEQKVEEESAEEVAVEEDAAGTEDGVAPEPASAKKKYLPSSMGMSVLVPKEVTQLSVLARWGDYVRQESVKDKKCCTVWQRIHREETVVIDLPDKRMPTQETDVPNSNGLKIVWTVRPVNVTGDLALLIPAETKAISIFLVNRRPPADTSVKDEAFAFQMQLDAHSSQPFVARPNLRSFESDDLDEQIADLQYHDSYEYVVGHAVSAEAVLVNGQCVEVKTCWIPQAQVLRVAPSNLGADVTLSMDALSTLVDGQDAQAKMGDIVTRYRQWIASQKKKTSQTLPRRKEIEDFLLQRASVAANRIEDGIKQLDDPVCLEAFRIANRVMAQQARQRRGVWEGKDPAQVRVDWFPFQLAFILMNLRGIVAPQHDDRKIVDLLFFPTGGGKTEAYLGLAAFTIVLRRLRNPNIASSGLTVLMRYTLRLLTLDQLSRAATMICALELERKQTPSKLGQWPFEIGLWVGQAATPNRMGRKGDNNQHSARIKTQRFRRDSRNYAPPIPLRECPWCGEPFARDCFDLRPNDDNPIDLLVRCANRNCAFIRGNYLPILAVDDQMYRRLPCFMIATVDKFASMPWTGQVGAFFGLVDRHDKDGFYGPCDPNQGHPIPGGRLPPPELIIQDELHLISGPLGTMAGLYEAALDELTSQKIGETKIRPKIVASTATVRRADSQIQALFCRQTDIFPPPGPDRTDSFFAQTHQLNKSNARLYVGVAAQGRSPKLIMLRVYLALLASAEQIYRKNPEAADNPSDPYMTLMGYYNSLRELGGCRRVIEDEVRNRLKGYGNRLRAGEETGIFADRDIDYEPVELTSRMDTASVAAAKRKLAQHFLHKDAVDVGIATNMISVGLDITRLGLMVVFGQPKSSAEYIQATSRVGRDPNRPGLVVTLLNIHKPRDRSHYERFVAYHESFYRSVEATSVTPFSPRALDRGLAASLVALGRLGHTPMTSPSGANQILNERQNLDVVVDVLGERAAEHEHNASAEEQERHRQRVRAEGAKLLDVWLRIARKHESLPGGIKYQKHEGGNGTSLLHDFLDVDLKNMSPEFMRFRANRSMRDVEPDVALWMKTFDGVSVDSGEEEEG